MTDTISKLRPILKKYRRGLARLDDCKLAMNAIRYDDDTSLRISVETMTMVEGDISGGAMPYPRQMLIRLEPKPLICRTLETWSHETKHVGQFDKAEAIMDWQRLAHDCLVTQVLEDYVLQQNYQLTSVIDNAFLHVGMEVDAHLYGEFSGFEAAGVFREDRMQYVEPSQLLLFGSTMHYMDAEEQINRWIKMSFETIKRGLDRLSPVRMEYGSGPAILPLPVSSDDVMHVTSGLWDTAGFTNPMKLLLSAKPFNFEERVRDMIKAHPGYEELESGVQILYASSRPHPVRASPITFG